MEEVHKKTFPWIFEERETPDTTTGGASRREIIPKKTGNGDVCPKQLAFLQKKTQENPYELEKRDTKLL